MKYFFSTLLLLIAAHATAAQFTTSFGNIKYIRSYGEADSPNQPTMIQIEGTNIRESCPHANLGIGDLNFWLIYPEEEQLLSIAMLAFAAEMPVQVTSNDDPSKMRDGACRVVYIDLKH